MTEKLTEIEPRQSKRLRTNMWGLVISFLLIGVFFLIGLVFWPG